MARWATSRQGFMAAFLLCVPLAFLYAVPFVFCGLILGLLLSAQDLPVRRIYALDLAGSATGAFAVLPMITALGVERAALVFGLVMVAGAGGPARPRSLSSRPPALAPPAPPALPAPAQGPGF